MIDSSIRFWKDAAFLTVQLLGSLLAFAFVIAILVFILRKPARRYKPLDLAVFHCLDRFTSPFLTRLMLGITFLGKHQFLIPANLSLILYFLFFKHHSGFSVRIAAISLSSLVLMLILKQLFRRQRPLSPLLESVRGLSFPSGHAIMSVTFFGILIYIIYQSAQPALTWIPITALVLLILLIGFSRVYLRVHYASDVLAGFLIGLLWLWISLTIVRLAESYFGR